MPSRISYSKGHIVDYIYDAMGKKLRVEYKVNNLIIFDPGISYDDAIMPSSERVTTLGSGMNVFVNPIKYIYTTGLFESAFDAKNYSIENEKQYIDQRKKKRMIKNNLLRLLFLISSMTICALKKWKKQNLLMLPLDLKHIMSIIIYNMMGSIPFC